MFATLQRRVMNYGNDAQIDIVITMPYVMERGKVSHAIKKRYLLCERYAAKLLYQAEDEKC